MNGKFTLRGLDIRRDLNEYNFASLPAEDREYFENATLRSTVIRNWPDENFLYKTFYRLNSGSLPLSPQELRKALIGGNLLAAIDDYLLASESYRRLFGNTLDKRMRDSELVLRFLAFDRSLQDYRGDFKKFLDATTQYFEDDWDTREPEVKEGFARLDKSLDVTHRLFGTDSFKKWRGFRYEKVINRAIFDSLTRFFCDDLIVKKLEMSEYDIIGAFKEICLEQSFRDSIEKTTKSVEATFYRVDSWGKRLADSLGQTYNIKLHRIT